MPCRIGAVPRAGTCCVRTPAPSSGMNLQCTTAGRAVGARWARPRIETKTVMPSNPPSATSSLTFGPRCLSVCCLEGCHPVSVSTEGKAPLSRAAYAAPLRTTPGRFHAVPFRWAEKAVSEKLSQNTPLPVLVFKGARVSPAFLCSPRLLSY